MQAYGGFAKSTRGFEVEVWERLLEVFSIQAIQARDFVWCLVLVLVCWCVLNASGIRRYFQSLFCV